MKKIPFTIFAVIAVISIGLSISSCGKEKNTPPDLSFAIGSAYVSNDTSLVHGTVFNIGISASKTGTDGLLAGCKIYHSTNGSSDSLIQEMNFVQQYFAQYYSYKAGDSGNIENYTFTVAKVDGSTNSINVNITDL